MRPLLLLFTLLGLGLTFTACHAEQQNSSTAQEQAYEQSAAATVPIQQKFAMESYARFNEPWALASLPDGRLLVTEKAGKLKLFDPATRQALEVRGVPKVAYGGQGGLGDVQLHPNFTNNAWVYLSYAEAEGKQYGAVVIRAKLDLSNPAQPKLTDLQRIWEQVPKVAGQGHYAHRIVFDTQAHLWISSGERQKFQPAQDMKSNLGKVLHLHDDGRPQEQNPFYQQGRVTAQIWSLGHRNPLGMAFDHKNQLWVVEMGPQGGDELNLVHKGKNYGYPLVSNGDHYDGRKIPDHGTRPEFEMPKLDWTPVISPSSLIFYQGKAFPQWTNKALIGGLSSKAIVVVDPMSEPVREVQRIDMGQRIRGLLQRTDGNIWVIEDGAQARLLLLKPAA